MIHNEFKDREGEIIFGIVRRFEKGNIIVDLPERQKPHLTTSNKFVVKPTEVVMRLKHMCWK